MERVNKSKKISLGKLNIDLNSNAEDDSCKQISEQLEKSPISPAPTIKLELRTYWETIDGYILKDSVKPVDNKKAKSKQLKEMVRRKSLSLFPTAKVAINGKSYELYENAEEEPPDASMSFLSRERSDTEIEFTCDVCIIYLKMNYIF